MISKRQDYSHLLDNLRNISHQYSLNFDYDVIDKNGVLQQDERIVNSFKFYMLYCMAYKRMDEIKENNSKECVMDKETINRALASYGMFNYLINTCIAEYRIYGDIGTGRVSYIPYESVADFFFENAYRKEMLKNFFNNELASILNDENIKKRVR